ncbi:hypothetical protein GCM10017788_19290 [Amycolatopsis acidiphila]|nr:hypothetical protein GCM10017788_19290 [Amycolatopsis acidiphila]
MGVRVEVGRRARRGRGGRREGGGLVGNGRDITPTYAELAALPDLVERPVLLDGDLVTHDDQGRPDFGRVRSRMHVRHSGTRLLADYPVAFYVFDLLHLAGADLTRAPYEERRGQLNDLDLDTPPQIRVPDCHTGLPGAELLEIARQSGLEGIVAKRLCSPYQPGARLRDWIKTPLRETQEVVVGAWTPGEGRRTGTLGALLLGIHDDEGRRVYAGHVGTGFSDRALDEMRDRLTPLARTRIPFDLPVPREYARTAGGRAGPGRRGRTPAMDLRPPPAPSFLAWSAPRPQPRRGPPCLSDSPTSACTARAVMAATSPTWTTTSRSTTSR